MKKCMFSAISILLVLFTSVSLQAATITWQVENLTSVSQINNGGNLLEAANMGGAEVTVNGVTFIAGSSTGGPLTTVFGDSMTNGGIGSASEFYQGPVTELNPLLDNCFWRTGDITAKTVTFDGLTVGKPYLIQLFLVDDRAAWINRYIDINSGTTWSIPPEIDNLDFTGGGTTTGAKIVTGTFVADAATQSLLINNFNPSDVDVGGQLNAYQIRTDDSASNPTPADKARVIPTTGTILSWNTGSNPAITGHFVYLGTDQAAVTAATPGTVGIYRGLQAIGNTSYNPGTLTGDVTHYWRIDERLQDDANFIRGFTWNFTTDTKPVITQQPVQTSVKPTETATFTVAAISVAAPINYQWYKVGTPDTQVGINSPTLSIINAQLANEGKYYCKVSNVNGATDSTQANLLIQRLIGHWPFDGNITDIVGGIPTAMQTGNPAAYDTGVVGSQAIKMVAGTVNPVVISTPAWAQVHSSWTISVWENMPATAPTSPAPYMMASGTDATGIDRFFFWRYSGLLDYEFRFYQGATTQLQLFGRNFAKEQWHLVTVTYDALTDTGNIYVDGIIRQSGAAANHLGFAPQIYVGNRKNLARPYVGRLDDLKLYNYPLNDVEVATAYYDVTGIYVCRARPQYDLSGDCIVNLQDVVLMVTDWMQCNLYPPSACQP